MYCTNCGAEIKEGSKFCTNCGKIVSSNEEKRNAHDTVECSNSQTEIDTIKNVSPQISLGLTKSDILFAFKILIGVIVAGVIFAAMSGAFAHRCRIEERVTNEATCTKPGRKEKYCTKCGEVKKVETISALGHSGELETVLEEATCTKDGKGIYKCKRCQETYEHKIYSSHDIEGGECVVCGSKKSDINADEWYVGTDTNYKTVYTYTCMNADVFTAASFSQGEAFFVGYYPVCQQCHMTGAPDSVAFSRYEPQLISYYCPACDEATAVKFEMDGKEYVQ